MKKYLKMPKYQSVLITVLLVIYSSASAFDNVPLHEWTSSTEDTISIVNDKGEQEFSIPKDLITWVFEDGTFIPMAKLQAGKSYSIITDHLGTPTSAYYRSNRYENYP